MRGHVKIKHKAFSTLTCEKNSSRRKIENLGGPDVASSTLQRGLRLWNGLRRSVTRTRYALHTPSGLKNGAEAFDQLRARQAGSCLRRWQLSKVQKAPRLRGAASALAKSSTSNPNELLKMKVVDTASWEVWRDGRLSRHGRASKQAQEGPLSLMTPSPEKRALETRSDPRAEPPGRT